MVMDYTGFDLGETAFTDLYKPFLCRNDPVYSFPSY